MKKNELNQFYVRISCILVSVFVLFSAFKLCIANAKTDSNALQDFLNALRTNKVSRVECYYAEWSDPQKSISEKELIESKFDFKTIAKFNSVFSFVKLGESLTFPPLEKVGNKNRKVYDCRLAYLFYNDNNELLRITFTSNTPIVLINGEAYKPSEKLLGTLLSILPKQAYDSFHSHMRSLWVNSDIN